jgi:hypothetical protein
LPVLLRPADEQRLEGIVSAIISISDNGVAPPMKAITLQLRELEGVSM